MASTIQDQWMVIGDFNNSLIVADIILANTVLSMEFDELEGMMNETYMSMKL